MTVTNGSCVACGACASACPKECINISKDENGFYMPVINNDLCTDCGKCRKICPVNNSPGGKLWKDGKLYAVWAKDDRRRFEGSSGGAFGLLADTILEKGGIVFGAAYSDDFKSVCQTNTDKVSLIKLKKSKYVESYTGKVFADVKAQLDTGRTVLYCGTSCQTDGLKNYLNKDYPNLLTCDFLCHGVPSAGIFEKYISNLEEKFGKVTGVDFRSKAFGWKTYCSKVSFDTEKVYLKTKFQDPYLRLFFEENVYREACYTCNRPASSNADITIGDFWNVSQTPEIRDTDEGISLVNIHTEKGAGLFDLLINKDLCFSTPLKQADCEYAYKPRVSRFNEELRKSALHCDNLFSQPVSLKTAVKGYAYLGRGLLNRLK